MKSLPVFAAGCLSLIGSLFFPRISAPLQLSALVLGITAEALCRYEEQYVAPVQERKRKDWLETLEYIADYRKGARQAFGQNKIDWRELHRNEAQNFSGSVQSHYLKLFTQGRPQYVKLPEPSYREREPETVTVDAKPVRDPFAGRSRAVPAESAMPAPVAEPQRVEDVPELKLESLEKTSFLLIWGTQGSGKTTLAKKIAQLRQDAGHTILVADPHGSVSRWKPWDVIGAGRNYRRLNEFLSEFDDQITDDYKEYAGGKEDFPWGTVVLDEFTQWADHCPLAAKFVKSACSDIRKINKSVIMISHTDTLTGMGNAAGMRSAIDRSAVKLELEAEINLESGEYKSTGYGWIEYPGKPRQRVRIPKIKKPWGQFTPVYQEFIKSPEWKAKRELVLQRDGHRCTLCGGGAQPDDPLQVDHISYPPRDATFDDFVHQPIDQLRTLHKSCHEFKTQKTRRN